MNIEYKVKDLKIQFNGKEHTIEGFADGNIIKLGSSKRCWWKETVQGFDLTTKDWKVISIIPVSKWGFFEKYLKNLEDSEESPFKINILEVVNDEHKDV